MAALSLQGIRKSFGETEVIHGVDLDIDHREFVVLVGPSGCGKSTLLRLIAGLEDISAGSLEVDGVDMTDEEPTTRGIAMVFQSYALYPHMTVEQNMGFGLKMAGATKTEIRRRVGEVAKILQLAPLLARKPKQLSGGQRQRVAIGRALVRDPKIFLFDEPLSNLDAELRVQMRVEIARLHHALNATMVYVTHDQVEAMTMADRIVVLRDGYVEQVGSPMTLYHHPANTFVAQFIGSPKMNLLPARVTRIAEGSIAVDVEGLASVSLPLAAMSTGGEDGVATLGIRPEQISVTDAGQESIRLAVEVAEHLGGTTFLYGRTVSGTAMVVQAEGADRTKPGDVIPVHLHPRRCHLFDGAGAAFKRLDPEM